MSGNDNGVPVLAPADSLVREIHGVLDLVRPVGSEEPQPLYADYNLAASEAYLHLAREADPERRLRVVHHGKGPGSRWWLLDDRGRVIDLALSPADRKVIRADPGARYPYEKGKGAMFRTGAEKPSKRGAFLLELVRSRR